MRRAQDWTLYRDLCGWINTIPTQSRVEFGTVLYPFILFFFFWSRCCLRISEAAGAGYTAICPPDSENALPESAAVMWKSINAELPSF